MALAEAIVRVVVRRLLHKVRSFLHDKLHSPSGKGLIKLVQ